MEPRYPRIREGRLGVGPRGQNDGKEEEHALDMDGVIARARRGAGRRGTHGPVRAAYAGCEAGTKIDRSTANDARRKIMAAGYKDVSDLKKS